MRDNRMVRRVMRARDAGNAHPVPTPVPTSDFQWRYPKIITALSLERAAPLKRPGNIRPTGEEAEPRVLDDSLKAGAGRKAPAA